MKSCIALLCPFDFGVRLQLSLALIMDQYQQGLPDNKNTLKLPFENTVVLLSRRAKQRIRKLDWCDMTSNLYSHLYMECYGLECRGVSIGLRFLKISAIMNMMSKSKLSRYARTHFFLATRLSSAILYMNGMQIIVKMKTP